MRTPKASPTPQIRVFHVDDHPLLRRGIADCIRNEPDMTVCGEAGSASEALPAIARETPDLVIVDISLPGRDGIELIKDIKARHHTMLILVYSMHDESLYAERVLRAGASGYVMKSAPTEMLIQAIRAVQRGELVIGAQVVDRMLARLAKRGSKPAMTLLECLTNRELEIFRLLGRGRLRREIAQQLHLGVKTIETHQANMCQKLDVKTTVQLRQLATEFYQAEAAGTPNP